MKKSWLVCSALAALFFAATAIVSTVHGECGGMLECTSGSVPMKCHWAFLATTVVGVGGFALALWGLTLKSVEARRTAAIAGAVLAVIILVLLWFAIGVCANVAMACVGNRVIVTVLAVLALVAELAGLAFAASNEPAKPKAKL